MKIAILGTRGIPNHYGGFEQYAELLSVYLAARGWEVVVYCSSDHPYQEAQYKGVRLKHMKDPERRWGTAGQFLYDLRCILDTRNEKFDLVYQLGYTSSAIFNFLFPRRTTIVTNMDGLEWKRSKYNRWVQQFLRFSEWLAARQSDHLVADATGIRSYLEEKYGRPAFYTPYTASIPAGCEPEVLQAYGVEPGAYDLLIARMEPENNIGTIIRGCLEAATGRPLLLVGNTGNAYGQSLVKRYTSCNIHFAGPVYDKEQLDSLRYYSRFYYHGHSVGGTNPSLLEAMACSCRILAHDNPFNRGVLQDSGLYFADAASLAEQIQAAAGNDGFWEKATTANRERIANCYSEAAVFSVLQTQLQRWRER